MGVMLLSNSANGESAFKELLEISIADVYTPWEWLGYVPYDRTVEGEEGRKALLASVTAP